jgi:metal-responsive CopG/Arc/MetJ family transcriptional regulator
MDNNFYKILETFKRLNESTIHEGMDEAYELITDLVNGEGSVDVYDVYAHPRTPIEKYVSELIHKYYENIVIDTGMHADDDVEEILDRVLDQMQHDYQIQETSFNFAGQAAGQKPGDQWRGTDAGTPGTKLVGEETVEISLEEELMNEWDQFLKELGAPGVASATSSTATTSGATPAAPNPADVAKKKADIQKNLQGIPGVDANKAVTNLTDPKDDSGIDAAITKVLTDPATSQQAKQLLAKGMK